MGSQSPASFLHVLNELPILSQRSFLSPRVVSTTHDYSGRAAILSRERPGAFLVPSRPPLISSSTYRLALPPRGQGHRHGRSRTFTGQCCQPFCLGDSTNHSDGPRVVTKYRHAGERIRLLRLQQVRELGPPPEPKRETAQTIFTWPLRHRSLPSDAGCIPSFEVRVKISERAWTRPGRI